MKKLLQASMLTCIGIGGISGIGMAEPTPITPLNERNIIRAARAYQAYAKKQDVWNMAFTVIGTLASPAYFLLTNDQSIDGQVNTLEKGIIGRLCSGGGITGNLWLLARNIKKQFESLLYNSIVTPIGQKANSLAAPLKSYLAEKTLLKAHLYQIQATLCLQEDYQTKKQHIMLLLSQLYKDLEKFFGALRGERARFEPLLKITTATQFEKGLTRMIMSWELDPATGTFEMLEYQIMVFSQTLKGQGLL